MLVETQVRQDAIVLFGFATAGERDTFRKLGSVQGVGTKLALDILSAFTPEELAEAVRRADRTGLRQANGVGAKLADRLVDRAARMGRRHPAPERRLPSATACCRCRAPRRMRSPP